MAMMLPLPDRLAIRRRVHLAHAFDPVGRIAVLERLRGVSGLYDATFVAPAVVDVVYDRGRFDYHSVLDALRGAGASPACGLWQGIRSELYQLLDENARPRVDGAERVE